MSLRTCDLCGFENAEQGKRCPLCSSTAIDLARDTETVTQVEASASSREFSDPPTATPESGGSSTYPRNGEVFAERYRVDGVLGRGGMGQVFQVRDKVTGRDFALKVMRHSDENDPRGNARIQREIAAMERVVHPAVPKLHDWGALGAQVYFVSELVYGHDLELDIQRRGAWPATEAAPLVATIADALAAAHHQGFIHRDVKPSNIMLATDGSVKLLDFGLARGRGIDVGSITTTGVAVGTPAYMSPEQFDLLDLDASSDIYSLGVVLFELLTGRLPFVSNTPVGVAVKHKTEPPPRPRQLQPDVPGWLEEIVLRCLQKDPVERPRSAAGLAADLRRLRETRPRWRKLPSGDSLLENVSESSDAVLELSSAVKKRDWSLGMALCFHELHYKLREVIPPTGSEDRWRYRFDPWPEAEVFRHLVDYEEDCVRQGTLGARIQRWLSGQKPDD